MALYQERDFLRISTDKNNKIEGENKSSSFRSEFWRDYGRLVHSASFRRLAGKTQLYPSHENDYFRTRLTHSLEVAQVAKSIALKVNHEEKLNIDTDLVEFAALAHDLGHPPFGHQGEEALDLCMRDFGGFEGNAQTLRILARLEKKLNHDPVFLHDQDTRTGLDLTYRTLASVLKYDNIIPVSLVERQQYADDHKLELEPVKGYYDSEKSVVEAIKLNILNGHQLPLIKNSITGKDEPEKFKTIECKIMDVSDDIAYSTFDLDDTLKANFSNPFDIVFPDTEIIKRISKKVSKIFDKNVDDDEVRQALFNIFKHIFDIDSEEEKIVEEVSAKNFQEVMRFFYESRYKAGKNLAQNGIFRNQFTSRLIDTFISGIEFIPHPHISAFSSVRLKDEIRFHVEILKTFNYEVNIMSSRLKIPAFRGKQIVENIFNILSDDNLQGYMLLPPDFKSLYLQCSSKANKCRVICDFIAGMTDKYCIEFHARLTSENAETIFKPI